MRKLYVILLFLMFFCVSMLFAANENDVINQSEVRTVKSSLRNYFWDFETGWQDWTHTNGQVFPGGWDVKPSNYTPSYILPDAGDSTMWIDADASGGTFWIQDTALSPAVVPPISMKWLKYGYVNVTYVGYFYNELHVGIRYFTSGVWNTVELKFYPASATSGPAWDSVDVSAYSTVDSVCVYFYFDDFYTWGYYAAFDNVELFEPIEHDVGCSAVTSPVGAMPAGENDVIGRIRNYGGNAETFDATAQVWETTGGAWTQIFNQTATFTAFAVGGDSFHNFGTVTLGTDSYFYTEIYTALAGDENPGNDTSFAHSRTAMGLGDIVFEMDVETPTGDGSLYGVEFDGTYFYLTGGNSGSDPNKVYVVDTTGTLIWTMDQPTHSTNWGWRDIAWDDIYAGVDRIDTLYASVNGNVDMFSVDLTSGTLEYHGYFNGPENPNRALACQPDTTFYTASISSPCYWFSRWTSNLGSASNTWSMYGAAYDTDPIDGGWVWWHSRDDAGFGWLGQIEQFDPFTMTFTGFNFGYMPTITVPAAAGGLCFYEDFRGMDVLFALVYGDPIDIIVGLYLREHVDVEEEFGETIPLTFRLAGIAPNPVRDRATVSYTTTRTGPVSLKIYDSAGRLIRTLVNRNESAGVKTVYWDGRDNNNRPVTAGVYFLRLTAEGKTATDKMVIVR